MAMQTRGAEKSLGCLFVASALHQDIRHVAVLIHCSPEVVLLTANAKPIYPGDLILIRIQSCNNEVRVAHLIVAALNAN